MKETPGKRHEPGHGEGEAGHRARLSEVAAAAGVSAMTVSRVVNGRAGVSAATRERVERAILAQELARTLADRRPGQHGFIGVLARSLAAPETVDMLRGIERRLQRTGFRVVLTMLPEAGDAERQALRLLLDGSTDGAILIDPGASMDLSLLRRHAVPFVALDPEGVLDPDLPAVGVSLWTGVQAATEHLLALGHRRIALLAGQGSSRSNNERAASFQATLMAEGLSPDPELFRVGGLNEVSGHAQAIELLNITNPPSAILCGSDDQAAGVYRALHERGLGLPAALSVIGFGDQSFSSLLSPSLTTVRCPYRDMGAMAGAMLLHLLAGEELEGRRVEVATSLVVRASCTSPNTC